ncbi:HNH endonuclease signature motif containing protein [Mycobacterium sp.]|uniref:HNH endonuclease signature motif containing protein n=1 Tax=Mycobacterium sp. TaxID=1785 RepID=UPI003F999ED1
MGAAGVVDLEAITAAFDAVDAAVDAVLGLNVDALSTYDQLLLLERCEKVRRRIPAIEHPLINNLARQATPEELGGTLAHAIADWALISRAQASRRINHAADLGPRHGLTGEPLAPVLAGTAARQRQGTLGAEHVAVIRRFYHQLPACVDGAARDHAATELAQCATQVRPEQLAELAAGLADRLNPDGTYRDEDRARRRGLTLGPQGTDGMSELRGCLTPEARATLEAMLAKLAAPGMCNPLDEKPCVDGAPTQDAIDHDARSAAQRNHDALLTAHRVLLAAGNLGQHNGLPTSIIVTTTLQELEAAAGRGLTGGGTMLPMSDVIRLGRHAHHYSPASGRYPQAIFDNGKALALYHTKRLASPGQRIVLYAKDRGCTRPGCNAPPYWCEVHHVEDWATTHRTDVNTLALACGSDHPLVEPGGWTTRKRVNGDTEWIPPAHLDHGQPRINTYHHPEKILAHEDDDDP